jgi:hypothetical protein
LRSAPEKREEGRGKREDRIVVDVVSIAILLADSDYIASYFCG